MPEPAETGGHEMRVVLSTLGAEVRVCAPPDSAALLGDVGVLRIRIPVVAIGVRR
jgi:hypothetical protein